MSYHILVVSFNSDGSVFNVSYHILVASLNSDGSVFNVSYHILVASLTLTALFQNRAIRVRLATSI